MKPSERPLVHFPRFVVAGGGLKRVKRQVFGGIVLLLLLASSAYKLSRLVPKQGLNTPCMCPIY